MHKPVGIIVLFFFLRLHFTTCVVSLNVIFLSFRFKLNTGQRNVENVFTTRHPENVTVFGIHFYNIKYGFHEMRHSEANGSLH
jgi:hypothetical protein